MYIRTRRVYVITLIMIIIYRVTIPVTGYFSSLMAAEIALSLGSVIALIALIQHFI